MHMGLKILDLELEDAKTQAATTLSIQELSENLASWKELANELISSCGNAVSVLNDLLNYDKVEHGTLQLEYSALNPWLLLRKGMEEFQLESRQKKVNIDFKELPNEYSSPNESVSCHFKKFRVFGDEIRLEQVLRNLLSNALKFTPQNGKIVVSRKIV